MSMDNDSELQSASTNNSGSRYRPTRHVSSACDACRKARSKCDGVVPCRSCLGKNIPCTLDRSVDGRRGRKRVLEELSSKADALNLLLKSLKDHHDPYIRELITHIQNDEPVDEVVKRLRLAQSQDRTPDAKLKRTVLDIASLVDEPPLRVSAKPWTCVTDDDLAVSHLISVYFTWQNHGYSAVDQEIFIRHMTSGDETSHFCSPFLVNCMLLAACMYTDHPSAFARPGDQSTRALHFLDETTKLWVAEQGRTSLTTLQALPAFITGVVALGKDRIGTDLTNSCIQYSSELTREIKKRVKRGRDEFDTEDFQQSYMLAKWAAFSLQTEVAIAWSKPLHLQKPSKECQYSTEALSQSRTWRPYPKTNPNIEYYPIVVSMVRFKLFEIASRLVEIIISSTPSDSPLPGFTIVEDQTKLDRLYSIKEQLCSWLRKLPVQTQLPQSLDTIPAGPLIDLHLAYNGFHIVTTAQILRISGISKEEEDLATQAMQSACLSVADLLRRHQQGIGLEYFGIYVPHAASLSSYHLLPYLDQPGLASAFHTTIVALSAVRDRWKIAHGIVRMLWIEIQQRNLSHLLGTLTIDLLKLNAVETWGPDDHRMFEQCAYPNYAAVRERGTLLAEMGELLEEYAKFDIDDLKTQS